MEVVAVQRLQNPAGIDCKKCVGIPSSALRVSPRLRTKQRVQVLVSAHLQSDTALNRNRSVALKVSCCYKNSPASLLESGGFHAPFDLVLENKSKEIEPYLNGRPIYLVGMMGSGKTTVGKILSQVLSYSFCDSDILIEQAVNGTSVAEIFRLYGEAFFREKETEVLQKLSLKHRLVVSTGGGAVIRPVNWKYMHKGISVWLDVPLEALAQRIAAVGTNSRPLLHHESGDAYTKAFNRLTVLWEQRGEAYARANARVSLENIAAKLGNREVSNLTPAAIAIEALEQIKVFLEERDVTVGEF